MKKVMILLFVSSLNFVASAQIWEDEIATFDTITFEKPVPFYFSNDTSEQSNTLYNGDCNRFLNVIVSFRLDLLILPVS